MRAGKEETVKTKLVIFDCDGVLVDSEPISLDLLLEMIRDGGGEVSQETAYREFLGRSMASVAAELEQSYGVRVTESLLAKMRAGLQTRFRRELKPIAGIAEALEGLDLPFCVASSSQPERIELSLEVCGIRDRFGADIFSASMVKKGKPAPDLFLLAAETMGVSPESCVVVEDSPAGIAAARAAGMKVIGFVGGSHAAPAGLAARIEALEPDYVLDEMAGLQHALRAIGAARS
jgi:HAD superfamily hydrolase (TIGR01509 family)